MEQHHPADEVEPQEHGQGESHVHRHPLYKRQMKVVIIMNTVLRNTAINNSQTTEGGVQHLRADLAAVVAELGGPQEVEPARDGVHGTHQQLHSCRPLHFRSGHQVLVIAPTTFKSFAFSRAVNTYLHHPLPGHRYPPVVRTVVNHEELDLQHVVSHNEHQQHHGGDGDQGLQPSGHQVLLQCSAL